MRKPVLISIVLGAVLLQSCVPPLNISLSNETGERIEIEYGSYKFKIEANGRSSSIEYPQILRSGLMKILKDVCVYSYEMPRGGELSNIVVSAKRAGSSPLRARVDRHMMISILKGRGQESGSGDQQSGEVVKIISPVGSVCA